MLFINDNESGLLKWRKDRRAGAQNDGSRAPTRCRPGPVTLRITHSRVQGEYRRIKSRLKACPRLWREGNLWQQDQRLLSALKAGRDALQVNFGFAASGHAVQ